MVSLGPKEQHVPLFVMKSRVYHVYQICEQCSAYVTKQYEKATVVFDAYSDTSSIKDVLL